MADKSILIISTNWIGDVIMTMPAVQIFRQENPEVKITVLAKPGTISLWKMHPAVNAFETLDKTSTHLPTIEKLKSSKFDCAYIFPNSFRAAYIPFRAGIKKRVGARGHWRSFMLTNVIPLGNGHQQFESMNILGVQGEPPLPQLVVPDVKFEGLGGRRIVTLLPGAARGPSKRWPPERFIELAKRLRDELGVKIILSGGPDDAESCAEMAKILGPEVISLAGKTTIPEWAALLKQSDCVVANDSGGMHLAAAVGTPVVGIFGITDPKKTGPLGQSLILQKSAEQSRNVARDSDAARLALEAVTPGEVYAAVTSLLRN